MVDYFNPGLLAVMDYVTSRNHEIDDQSKIIAANFWPGEQEESADLFSGINRISDPTIPIYLAIHGKGI